MSLKRLFSLTLGGLLLVILLTVFSMTMSTYQLFIQNQVYSSSQDAVNSLGLSISTLDIQNSKLDVELMINAIFDSGYYEYIKLYDINNVLIYENSHPLVVKDVPSWMITVIPIELQEASSVVNDGWKNVATITLKGHIGYAYYEMYNATKKLIIIFFIITVVAFVLLMIIINTLLRSLKRIENQANSINEHKFVIEESAPFILEFNTLIKAMNQMVRKVEGIFKSEVNTFEQYQNILYRDEETALPNKKYFILKLKEALADESHNLGYIALISIDGLEKLKNDYNYVFYKETLQRLIYNIPKALAENNLVSRISSHEIAILFNTHDKEKVQEYFEQLQTSLDVVSQHIKTKEKLLSITIGVAPYFEKDKLSETLSRVDYSLSRSKINGCNLMDIYSNKKNENDMITLGKNNWKSICDNIFSQDRVLLAMQSTINKVENIVFHDEVLIRIREVDNSIKTAGYYLPMANALGLISKFDDTVIKKIVRNMNIYINPIAVNISKDFILQSVCFLELRNSLSKLRSTHPGKLHFECPENEILLALDSYVEFSDMVHAHKQLFGIDRFSGLQNIGYIEKVRPDYIKINVNFMLEALDNNSAILKTLNVLSRTMGTKIIITAIQNESQYKRLKDLGYQDFQGHYISDVII